MLTTVFYMSYSNVNLSMKIFTIIVILLKFVKHKYASFTMGMSVEINIVKHI